MKQILVDDKNTVYTSIDGVLYSKTENGLVLEQYPSGRDAESYLIESGTVMVRDSAFEGMLVLKEVEIPYTVKTIGAYAFFNNNIEHYIFNSIQAPTLLAEYYDFGEGEEEVSVTNFYANFLYYAAFVEYKIPGAEDFGLTVTVPKNGKGYDGVWNYFFSTIKLTAENMADDNTHKAMEAIEKLPSVEEIKAIASLAEIKKAGGVGELAAAARKAYNLVAGAEQLELAKESLATLLAVEKALREKKEVFGEHVGLQSMVVVKAPTKSRYEDGETFDPTGMQMKVIYTDGSEVELGGDSRYTATPNVLKYDKLTYGSITVTITYTDGADSISTDITVMVNPVPEPVPPTPTPNKGGLSKSAVIAIAVVIPVVVLLAAGAVVAVLLIKKKKNNGSNDGGDDNNDGDNNGGSNDELVNNDEFASDEEFANEEPTTDELANDDSFAHDEEPALEESEEVLVDEESTSDEE
ncbi:MAG: hypothetical protein HDT36_01515 [Clostridiales bacterium]|nr:hypothetical protein [Clostridiales bacterium]